MNIGILALGGRKSIGTAYYVINLVKALKTLPADERPTITLIEDADTDRQDFQEIHTRVDRVDARRKSSGSRLAVLIGRSVAPFLTAVPGALSMARRYQKRIRTASRDALAQRLASDSVDVIFPCVWNMGVSFPTPWIPWIWDLQHKYYPDFFPSEEIVNRDRRISDMLSEAAIVVTSSDGARRDIEKHWPEYAGKVRILHFRSVPEPDWFLHDSSEVERRYGLPDKYLILPNHFWVHKNHRVAFEAMKALRDRGLDVVLVCTGSTTNMQNPRHVGELRQYLNENHLNDRVRILGFIPRADQIQLIRSAAAVLQPSLFEGWSTLVEDSRMLGKTLFLSDIAVHREQKPAYAHYFDPQSVEALVSTIASVWDELTRGGSREHETEARRIQGSLVTDYARAFLRIAGEAVARGRASG